MESICNKIRDMDLSTVAKVLVISVPGYILGKKYIVPVLSKKYTDMKYDLSGTNCINTEEDILEAKVKSENVRSGPAFINAHAYHGRRMERVKNAYVNVCNLVNQNLDLGNKNFFVSVGEDDPIILKVVRRLLIDELDKDGYTAKVDILPTLQLDEDNKEPFALEITIV